MSKLQFVPHIVREYLLPADFEREPEPDLVMDRKDQVSGYLDAGSEGGGMYIVHLFHAAHMTQTMEGARKVVDLACGPATQLLLLAQLHPSIEFLGVDLSAPMLEAAERRAAALGLRNVRFEQCDITDLRAVPAGTFDVVSSTMALHHLPTLDHLRRCFGEIARVLPASGRVYIGDLIRFRRRSTVY
ncbi:MAG: class I SAM-dependent methyltransferase, partial [Acetobacteraceae bacterium]|nr:class I SAM-dependent methyltransferase [Acetobacteraceae bacterium]